MTIAAAFARLAGHALFLAAGLAVAAPLSLVTVALDWRARWQEWRRA